MGTKNDKTILKLKEEVKKQKELIKKIKPFSPVTNCSLELGNVRYNLNVLNDKNVIMGLMIRLNSNRLSAIDLGFETDFKQSGFTIDEWLEDLKSKLLMVGKKEEETRLKKLEDKLHELLSTDKKVELEIDDISKEIFGE